MCEIGVTEKFLTAVKDTGLNVAHWARAGVVEGIFVIGDKLWRTEEVNLLKNCIVPLKTMKLQKYNNLGITNADK